MCCPDTPVCGHPPEYSLSTKRLLTLPSPEAMTIGLQWSLLISYPFHAGMLTGLILYGSCTGTAAEFLVQCHPEEAFNPVLPDLYLTLAVFSLCLLRQPLSLCKMDVSSGATYTADIDSVHSHWL